MKQFAAPKQKIRHCAARPENKILVNNRSKVLKQKEKRKKKKEKRKKNPKYPTTGM
jgi:hypothetical protein